MYEHVSLITTAAMFSILAVSPATLPLHLMLATISISPVFVCVFSCLCFCFPCYTAPSPHIGYHFNFPVSVFSVFVCVSSVFVCVPPVCVSVSPATLPLHHISISPCLCFSFPCYAAAAPSLRIAYDFYFPCFPFCFLQELLTSPCVRSNFDS